jgi:hypothetical protein
VTGEAAGRADGSATGEVPVSDVMASDGGGRGGRTEAGLAGSGVSVAALRSAS